MGFPVAVARHRMQANTLRLSEQKSTKYGGVLMHGSNAPGTYWRQGGGFDVVEDKICAKKARILKELAMANTGPICYEQG